MRDYERESFILQGWEIEMLVAECRKDPVRQCLGDIPAGDREATRHRARRYLASSPRHITRTNQSAPAGERLARKTGDRAGPCAGPSALSWLLPGGEIGCCEERACPVANGREEGGPP
jgi:hypothetical protein